MLGKNFVDLLAKQAKSAGKAVPKGYHGAPMPKASAAMPKGGYHGAPKPKRGTRAPMPATTRKGYRGAPMPRSPHAGYHGARMPVAPGPMHGPPVPVPGPMHGPLTPPPKQPGYFARHGKKTAAAVAGGAMVGGAIKNRTGKAVDPTTGLPKGMYGY